MSLKTLALTVAGATAVAAHGVILQITNADGEVFGGWDANYVYYNPVPEVAAWEAGGFGHGPITGEYYNTSSINCHDDAIAAPIYANASAGSSLDIVWGTPGQSGTTWPTSHKGPIITYLAPCRTDATGDCTSLNATDLSWTKIYQSGLITAGDTDAQVWATDELISANKTSVTIPADLKAGNYVLRHEIIALHAAGTEYGAQNYPQCYNFKITGSGTQSLTDGTKGTELYSTTEDGIVFNIYDTVESYPIPGPELWSGATTSKRRVVREFRA